MGKVFKAGLLALTTLAATVPALAQDNGDRRGGMGHQGGGRQGGEQRGNGGAPQQQQPRNDAPRPNMAPRPEARPDARPNMGQRPDNGQWRGNGNAQWQGRPPGQAPSQPVIRPQAPIAAPNRDNGPDHNWNQNGRPGNPGWQGGNNRPNNPGWQGGNNRPGDGRPNPGGWQNQPGRPNQGNWQGQGGFQNRGRISNDDRWRDQRRWSNDWRRDNRYDWTRYRQYNRGFYHLPSYRPPIGWSYGYSRFSIGVYLGGALYNDSYWIDDPYSYRLPPAYGTLRWVRYYDDALLVDIRDGYVVDVIHDFFW
jgi:hypothetical protein